MKVTLTTDQGEVLGIYPVIIGEPDEDGPFIFALPQTGRGQVDLYLDELTDDIKIHIRNGVN